MKRIVTFLMICLATTAVYAQDTYTQSGGEEFEEQALEITSEYNKHLYMNETQPALFQKKVVEFLISREKIKESYEGREMLERLTVLSEEETREMGDILTRMQLEKYREVKMQIQPIAVAEDN